MFWYISPDDAGSDDGVAIYNTAGEVVSPGIMFEDALQLVKEHNTAVEQALVLRLKGAANG